MLDIVSVESGLVDCETASAQNSAPSVRQPERRILFLSVRMHCTAQRETLVRPNCYWTAEFECCQGAEPMSQSVGLTGSPISTRASHRAILRRSHMSLSYNKLCRERCLLVYMCLPDSRWCPDFNSDAFSRYQ